MNIPLAKLKAIILYFTDNTDQRYLGKVKLMKLFYYLDFSHVKKFGTPITGDEYFHLEKGPIPSAIMNMIGELANDPENSKLADEIIIETPAGTRMQRIVGLRKFNEEDAKYFTQSEFETLKEVAEKFRSDSTSDIIEASHDESPWKETKYGQSIPYELAAHDADSTYSEEDIRFLESLAK